MKGPLFQKLGCVLQMNFFFSNLVLKFRVHLAFECVLYLSEYGKYSQILHVKALENEELVIIEGLNSRF